MKLSKLAVATSVALALSLLTVLPAEARVTPNTTTAETSNEVAGLIVKYKANVNPIAPNGEPTGENFAGVDLENSTDLGAGFKSVDFADDLDSSQVQDAVEQLELDPRVESVSINQVFQAANYGAKPIAGSILPNHNPVSLPIVIRSAVKVAAAPATVAADAWKTPNQVAVKLTWTKPSTVVSGKIAGYKIDIYANGTWKTLKSLTSASTRTYTSTSTYLKAGVQSKFRVAAMSYYYGRYYTGKYRYINATPTALPKPNTRVQVQNASNEMRFSWTPLTNATDLGGLQVSYQLQVLKNGTDPQTCVTSTSTTCVISPVSAGERFTATLTITNDRGSVTVPALTATFMLSALVNANDEYFNKQWHLKSGIDNPYGMKVVDAWGTESGSGDIYVAVLDTGITSHPDLNANVLAGYDMISDPASAHDGNGRDADASDSGDYYTDNGSLVNSSWHGTHVAGIIAALDNSVGVLGVAPNVKIIPVRVLGANGGTEADIVAGLNWAAGIPINGVPTNTTPANVINMSIGGQGTCPTGSPTQSALANIKNRGITVVTASGNDSDFGALSYPGNCYPTINVAATGKTGKPTFYSNYGAAVDIAAPGGDYCYAVGSRTVEGQIFSTLNTGLTSPGSPTYNWELGTSMASPNVAGVVALMYAAALRQTPTTTKNAAFVDRVIQAIQKTARNGVLVNGQKKFMSAPTAAPSGNLCVSSSASTQSYGAGLIDAEAAINEILNPTP